ncbi:MAG: hypothetical protein ACYDHF_06040 [Candidatus Cryosericum sp.]
MFRSIPRLPEFDGDLKRLKKRYPSLDGDLDVLTRALYVWLHIQGKPGQSCGDRYVVMSGYSTNIGCCLYKIRHMACAAIPGKGSQTGLRVVCAYWPGSDTLEFIQLYFKADSGLEDQKRIRNYVKTVRR